MRDNEAQTVNNKKPTALVRSLPPTLVPYTKFVATIAAMGDKRVKLTRHASVDTTQLNSTQLQTLHTRIHRQVMD